MSQISFSNNIDSTKPVSTFKVAFQPEVFKTEKYTMEISIPQNFRTIKLAESAPHTMQFPDCKKFSSGLLSETTCPYTVKGSFCRETCRIVGLEFLLPHQIGSQTLTMKPFDIDLFAKKIIIRKLEGREFPTTVPVTLGATNCYRYCTDVNLSSVWTDSVDKIRITWEILIRKSTGFVLLAPHKKSIEEEIAPLVKMSESIGSFYNSKDLSDATLLCGDQVFNAHRFILSCGSPVFKNMFLTEMKEKKEGEVVIKNIEANILELLIKWIYTKDIPIDNLEDGFDLYKAAHLYHVKSLKDKIITIFFENISIDNALEMYRFAETYTESELLKEALQIIKTSKDKVFEDEEIFKEFSVKYPKMMMELVKDSDK